MTTMSSVSVRVFRTSLMASWMYSVESYGMPAVMPAGSWRLKLRQLRAHALDDVERVRGRQHPDAHEGRGLAVEADVLVVVLGAEHDVGDLAEPDDVALLLLDDELLELLGRLEVGVGDEVDRHHRALGRAERGEVVVGGQQRRTPGTARCRAPPSARASARCAWRRCARPGCRRAARRVTAEQLRLHDARQVVGDLVLVEVLRGEPDVHGRRTACRPSAGR